MEQRKFTLENCQLVTDDSCCLNNKELMALNVEAIPYLSTVKQLKRPLKTLLRKKEFVLFVGTAPSLSGINQTVKDAAAHLDKEDKRLNASERIIVFNTSCFSGGLGFFVTLFAEFFNSSPHTLDELKAYCIFLANHIAHFFVEPSSKRWNYLIYAPRTGPLNYDGGKFRGNKGVYNFLAANFRDYAYHPSESIWICYSGLSECDLKHVKMLSEEEKKSKTASFSQARSLARQFKRCGPETKIDLSHKLAPHPIGDLSEETIACFYLSTDVRPDEPDPKNCVPQCEEIERKNAVAKKNITTITRYSQAYHRDPCPEF